MNERIEVTPSALRECGDSLIRAVAAMSEDLDRVADAADVLRLEWTGDAQIAFDGAQTRLRAELEARGENLKAIARAVANLANSYGETDRAGAYGLGGQ